MGWRRSAAALSLLAFALAACGSPQGDSVAEPPGDGTGGEGTTAPADWEPEFVDGVLQPLPDGFPEREITLINPDEPGHDDGLYVRAMQQACDGVSPVPINVRDEGFPQFGTWAGIEMMQSQPGGSEGYHAMVAAMTGAALDLLTEPIEEEFGLTLDDLTPVVATERTPFVMVTRADAPWQTYEELVEAAKAEAGSLRYIASVGSQLDIAMERLMSVGEWEAEKIPADGSSEAATIVAAGEGDFTMLTPSVALIHQEAGRVRPLLVISDEQQPPDDWSDATTTAAIGLEGEPWGSIRGLIVAPEVPELHRAWLAELIRACAEKAPYQERIEQTPGAEAVDMGPEEIRAAMERAIEFAEPIIRELGLHHEQN